MSIIAPIGSLVLGGMKASQRKRSCEPSDYFSAKDLSDIADAVRRAEKNTSGEIRVRVIGRYDPDLENNPQTLRLQALRDFEKEGMHNTRDKTGVLLLLVLQEKKFIILADSGIHAKLPQQYWEELAETLVFHFRVGNPAKAISMIVENIGERLAEFFPKQADDTNELSDSVSVGE